MGAARIYLGLLLGLMSLGQLLSFNDFLRAIEAWLVPTSALFVLTAEFVLRATQPRPVLT